MPKTVSSHLTELLAIQFSKYSVIYRRECNSFAMYREAHISGNAAFPRRCLVLHCFAEEIWFDSTRGVCISNNGVSGSLPFSLGV